MCAYMMKCLLLFTLLVSSFAFAGAPNPADEKAVLAAEKQYADAMLKPDAAALEKLLGDELSYTHSSALHESKSDVLKQAKEGTLNLKSIEVKSTKVRQYGDTVITNHQMIFTQNGRPSNNLFVTMVWVKGKNGAWQMVQRQATKLPDQQ